MILSRSISNTSTLNTVNTANGTEHITHFLWINICFKRKLKHSAYSEHYSLVLFMMNYSEHMSRLHCKYFLICTQLTINFEKVCFFFFKQSECSPHLFPYVYTRTSHPRFSSCRSAKDNHPSNQMMQSKHQFFVDIF